MFTKILNTTLACSVAAVCLHADGRMDRARKDPWEKAKVAYNNMLKSLDSGNLVQGQSWSQELYNQMKEIQELLDDSVILGALDERDRPTLKSRAAAVGQAVSQCVVFSSVLKEKIGRENFSSQLSYLKGFWDKFG